MNKVVVKILGSEYNIVGKNPEQMKNRSEERRVGKEC